MKTDVRNPRHGYRFENGRLVFFSETGTRSYARVGVAIHLSDGLMDHGDAYRVDRFVSTYHRQCKAVGWLEEASKVICLLFDPSDKAAKLLTCFLHDPGFAATSGQRYVEMNRN